MRILLTFAVAGVLCLCGCFAIARNGVFDGSDAAGWLRRTGNGEVSVYTARGIRKPEGQISFATVGERSVYVHIYYFPARPTFGATPVEVIRHVSGARQTLTPQEELTLDLSGCRDFTFILPSFSVDGVVFPPFRARFVWSDRAARYYQQLQ
jgi:hypothetical protein